MATSTYQNGVASTWTYRSDNLVTSINSTSPGGTPTDGLVANLAYTWDANKNKLSEVLTGVNATVNGYGFNAVDTTYDFEDRLTQWKRANGAQNQSWSLTAVGDWQSQTVNGTATSRTHGPTHELTAIGASSLSYDAKGNLTQDTSRSPTQNYVWDYDNKMRSADIDGNGSADVSFEYDALGRRVARTQGANAVVYFVGLFSLVGIAPSSRWTSLVTRRRGAVLFAHRNQQLSIYSYSNSSGPVVEHFAYTAYGQPTFMNAAGTVQSTSPNSVRYSYTGREWDASLQLHHFRARWMGPVTGRFLGRDPLGMTDGPNLYANYFLLSLLDPNGMRCLNCCCCPKDLFARERYSESKVVPPGDENNPFGKYYLSMAFEVIAHVEFNLNNITFDQDRGCTIKWYECGTRDSSIGGKANEWNVIPDNLAERLRGGLDGDPPGWTNPISECGTSAEYRYFDAPSLLLSKGATTDIKFAVRISPPDNCDCKPLTIYFAIHEKVMGFGINGFPYDYQLNPRTKKNWALELNSDLTGEPSACNKDNIPFAN